MCVIVIIIICPRHKIRASKDFDPFAVFQMKARLPLPFGARGRSHFKACALLLPARRVDEEEEEEAVSRGCMW